MQEGVYLSYIRASVVDFEHLEYISSAGLVILLKTQKRLAESGAALKIYGYIRERNKIKLEIVAHRQPTFSAPGCIYEQAR